MIILVCSINKSKKLRGNLTFFKSNLLFDRKGKGKGYSTVFENLQEVIQKMISTRNTSYAIHLRSTKSFEPYFSGMSMEYNYLDVGQI